MLVALYASFLNFLPDRPSAAQTAAGRELGHQQTQHPSLPKLHPIIVRIATSSVGCPKTSLAETMVIMRLALLLPLAYAADDHIKPAEFLSKWGTDELPPDATISTPSLAEAWMKRPRSGCAP